MCYHNFYETNHIHRPVHEFKNVNNNTFLDDIFISIYVRIMS